MRATARIHVYLPIKRRFSPKLIYPHAPPRVKVHKKSREAAVINTVAVSKTSGLGRSINSGHGTT